MNKSIELGSYKKEAWKKKKQIRKEENRENKRRFYFFIEQRSFWEEIVFCYQNCYKILLEKMEQVWMKNFFKITAVEKEHQGRGFWGQGHFWGRGRRPRPRNEGRGREMLPRCAFSTKVTWKHFLFTRVIFYNTIL